MRQSTHRSIAFLKRLTARLHPSPSCNGGFLHSVPTPGWHLLLAIALAFTLVVSLSPLVLAGDGDIDNLPPIPQPEKKHPNLDSSLAAKAEEASKKPVPGPSRFAPQTVEPAVEKVRVIIEAQPGQKDNAVAAAQAAGAQVEATYEDLVQAMAPLPALTGLANNPGIRFVRPPFKPVPHDISSEGLSLIGTAAWQGANIRGQGVKIAVVDSGFKGYASLLGTELPSSVIVQSFRSDQDIQANEEHGAGVAEIVYDIAPGAQLYLVNFNTSVELGNAVDWLIAQNVNIISHSIGWYGAGPGDGTGPINDIVTKATNAGILWVNSAGNSAQEHWGGSWLDTDGDGWLEFQGTDEGQTFTAYAGSKIEAFLTWDDPWGASINDYDLYLVNSSTGATVAASLNRQNGNDAPEEDIEYVVPAVGQYYLLIRKYSSNKTSKFNLFNMHHPLQYTVASGSIGIPADSPNALSVGAVRWDTPSTLEYYSSQGPTVDGRTKPDLVAPSRVSTVTYGTGGFAGTSSSAPHVSAATALVKQANPTWTPAQIKAFLESRAVELGAAGKDNQFGAGRLNLGELPALWISSVALSSPTSKGVPTFSWAAASGAASYEVRMDGVSWTNVGNVLTYTGAALSNGNHTFDVRASDGAGNLGVSVSVAFAIDTLAAADKDVVVEVASSVNQPGVQKAVAGPNRVAPTVAANVGDTITFKAVRGTITFVGSSSLTSSLSSGSATGVTTEASGIRFLTTIDTYPSTALVAGNGDFSPGSAVSVTVNGSPVTTVPASPTVGTGAPGDAGTGKFAPVSITVPSLKRATASSPHVLKLSDGVTEITVNLIINPRAQFTPEIGGNGQLITVAGSGFRSSSSIDVEVRVGISLANGTGVATGAPMLLTFPFDSTLNASHAVQVTTPGTFNLTLPPGTSGTATSGTATLTGSPVALAAGVNTVTTVTAGTFVVDLNALGTPSLIVSQGVLITDANGSFTGTFAAPDIMAAASPANTINAMDGGAARANATGFVSGIRFFVLDNTPPAAPAGLNATPSATSIALTWTANTEADIAGYKIYYDTKAGPPFQGTGVAQGNSPITVGNVAAYTLSGLNTGIPLHVALTAYDTHGNESDYSQGKQVTPVAAPGSLSKTTPDNDNTPTLTWSAVSGAAWYDVSMDGGTYSNMGNVLTYTVPVSVSDGPHTFYVRAVDGSGNAGPAANLSFTIDTVAPTAPAGLTKTSPVNDNRPAFTWTAATDSGSGVDHYDVQLDSGSWTNIGDVTAYSWPSAVADGNHTVSIRAADKATNAGASASVSFGTDATPPTVPGSLARTTPDSDNTPSFTWMASTDATTLVFEYRARFDSAPFASVGNVTAYTAPAALADGSHTFEVKAVDIAGNESNAASVTFIVDVTPPTAPTGLVKTTPDSNNKPGFSWTASTDATSGLDHYEVSMDSGAWNAIGNVTGYTWLTALSAGSHTFQVKAVDKAGNTGSPASVTFALTAVKPLDVQWVSHTTPTTLKPGETVSVPINLTNTGSLTWPKGGANPVNVSYHWLNATTGAAVVWDGLRSALPGDVASGETATVTATLKAPPAAGSYTLRWDLVQEGITWFWFVPAPFLDA
ncbi:MAG: S8 family serine peptidase, partial [Chloroflexi bacterium]|nr:S8 family serine peptidase [Chloroflexota bacterium]